MTRPDSTRPDPAVGWDRPELRIAALGDAIDRAERGAATVVPIALVRAYLDLPRPPRAT